MPASVPPPAAIHAGPRQILGLAVPAFLALVAEPLFLMVDAAVVGRLGVIPLAGLGAASSVLLTAAGIFVFLAYGTTSVVARQYGAGSRRGALELGVGGVWLAGGLGLLAGIVVGLGARPLAEGFSSSPGALDQAVIYLRVSAIGLPAMLLVLAATGILRGLQDTRTPLVVATAGFGANAVLSVVLVLGLDLGIAGAAWGTVIAQWGMALALLVVVLRGGRAAGASLRPHVGRVIGAALDGLPLLIRTLALRAVILLTVAAAASFGDVPLASYQVTTTIWSLLVFALDALAIAGQALTGAQLGSGDARGARAATTLMVRWGVWGGVALGAVVLALHRVLPSLFTDDPAVRSAIAAGLVVVALGQPLAGYVFVIDGVLIGAGDGRWLAGSMALVLVAYLPVVLVARAIGGDHGPEAAVVTLWIAFTVFMAVRGLFMAWRIRGDAWAVTGAQRTRRT
ncbi:MATE family efflux transporter [Janibacter sp. Soil728]|uniref:MATE family efflux transporter n=1 Tax=Janibacter sp. Soil728 TaxID=1736393 RepID=UPI0006F5C865|nr:MATE family efflux transporter [Janibacter sp. Soil728]KRE39113.1 MATE family efflux transporter [Janibacter sp. Soil728]